MCWSELECWKNTRSTGGAGRHRYEQAGHVRSGRHWVVLIVCLLAFLLVHPIMKMEKVD